MRLDNRYFTPFIAVCALLTGIVIVWGSISYSDRQQQTFRNNLAELDSGEIHFAGVAGADSLSVASLQGRPVLIHFWATWSGRSQELQQVISDLQQSSDLIVIAASVRDDTEWVGEYVSEQTYDFHWVEGTELYQRLQVPGVPSQFLLGRDGKVADLQVGQDEQEIRAMVESLP